VNAQDPFEGIRARSELCARVRAELHGSGLDIRDRENALVISNPGHPDNGRIYITYATAEVSLYLPVWHYLGHLPGAPAGDDPDDGPTVDAAAIVAALTRPQNMTGPAGETEGTAL